MRPSILAVRWWNEEEPAAFTDRGRGGGVGLACDRFRRFGQRSDIAISINGAPPLACLNSASGVPPAVATSLASIELISAITDPLP
jgi:hypothetical protein